MFRPLLVFAFVLLPQMALAQLAEHPVAGHLVIVYRNNTIPANADALTELSGGHVKQHLRGFGLTAISTSDEIRTTRQLLSHPEIAAVLHDRFVAAHSINLQKPTASRIDSLPQLEEVQAAPSPISFARRGAFVEQMSPTDALYGSPQGWAVRQSGGFGNNVAGGASVGPWTISMGAGVRIAVLDSGVDATHPDIAPNLQLNLSEVRSLDLPSPCDDGSPQDQQGHGTWVASLATGAIGPSTGETIGVAPQASLLNIKVLQRMPSTNATTPLAACESGQAGGLLSWVLQGIQDAVANRADIVTLSLGTLVDITTGDGAGWKAAFDHVTYAAAQSGTLIVAATGNDRLNLDGNLIELPAQARGVLAVTASTNPDCAEDLLAGAICTPGPVTRPYYSNFGAKLNAISAPGGSYPSGPEANHNIASGFVRGACSMGLPQTTDGLPLTNDHSLGCFNMGHVAYVQAIGTSVSAPLVAGAAAILRAAHPQWSVNKLIATLRNSATVSAVSDPQLNLPAALALP